jgi:hypothetical protein
MRGRNIGIAALLAALTCSSALAEEWAQKMFEVQQHDFGTVAAGAKAEYEFVLKNIYMEDVHIASVRSSCGCTTPSIKNETLKTYEKGAILAHFNTGSFRGSRGATLTVVIDKPYYAEIQLQVSGYIRGDVVITPGSVRLGTIEQGTPSQSAVVVNYAGRDDWQITGVKSNNRHLTATVTETSRGSGLVNYKVAVKLDKSAPAGYLNEHLVLTTNDSRNQVPLVVEGQVQPGISVSPSSLFLGVVKPGQKVTKQLVIRGKKPFKILNIACDGKGFQFDTSKASEAKVLHLVPVTFVAGEESGRIAKTIRIETDLGVEATPALSAFAVVADR